MSKKRYPDETNALLGSLTHRSESRYGIKRPNPFVNDPLKYVTKTDLTAECDFKEVFLNATGSIIREDLLAYRRQTLLSNGRQTAGNLFGLTTGSRGELEKIIRIEVEKYRMVSSV